ncbi:MAG: hypothetical protein K5746_06445, partial [Clostridiales bacterium]|nr:hypothetical protein [Clostridiales bacterium]
MGSRWGICCMISSLFILFGVLAERDAGVVSAEAEGIGDTDGDVALHGNVRRIVQVALGIWAVQVDGGRDDA